MTRGELKALVKECLLEVLQEGLQAQSTSTKSRRKSVSGKSVSTRSKSRRRHPTDFMEVNAPSPVPANKNDPIMESIFADTAATTLQEQAAARANPAIPTADHAARIALENEPADLFEGAQNWSMLAFDV